MSERTNDDIANALHGLASGQPGGVDDPETGTGAQHAAQDRASMGMSGPAIPPPAAPPPQRGPGPSSAGMPRPTPKPRPMPSASPPVAPSGRAVVPTPQRPASPANAAGPAAAPSSGRPASPVQVQPGRASRAATPPPSTAVTPGSAAPDTETTDVQPVDDDDRVIVPAAPLSALGPKLQYRPAGRSVPVFKTLSFRRTAIPILLTCSVLMVVVAGLKYTVNPDSVMALLPAWIPLVLVAAAVVFLGVAILNMAQVRQQLAAEKAEGGAAVAPGRGGAAAPTRP